MRGAEAAYRLHLAEQVIEHVAPVAEHVEDDPPAVLRAIVPRRPLRRLPVALEHPVAELAPDRQHPPEEPAVAQHRELPEARQEQLVLHHPVLHPRRLRLARQRDRVLQPVRDRLLAIDVLARIDRPRQQPGAHLRRPRIEEQRVLRVRQRRVEVVAPPLDPVRAAPPPRPWRRCARPGSDPASAGPRSTARSRPRRGSPRSSAPGAGCSPCAR